MITLRSIPNIDTMEQGSAEIIYNIPQLDDNKKYKERDPYGIAFMLPYVVLILILTGIAQYLYPTFWLLTVSLALCAFGLCTSFWLYKYIMNKPCGTIEMQNVSEPIREGAKRYLLVQYRTIGICCFFIGICVYLSYYLVASPSEPKGIDILGNTTLANISIIGFIFGVLSSGACGFISMYIASLTNVRVTHAAVYSIQEPFLVCFRGGAFSALLLVSLCMLSSSLLFIIMYLCYVRPGIISILDLPLLFSGYSFGCSCVALFMQLGGGIYTKGADVGADMCGKIEMNIPEDDPRNPAVIADLVGDMVGDCVGSCADIYESISAEVCSSMILGAEFIKEIKVGNPLDFVLFPLFIHSMDIFISYISIQYTSYCIYNSNESNFPMTLMKRGYFLSVLESLFVFFITTKYILHSPVFFLSAVIGISVCMIYYFSVIYYTDYTYPPVRKIASAATQGHATTIITGLATGCKSTVFPTISAAVAMLLSYYVGLYPYRSVSTSDIAGTYSISIATMALLSTTGYILTMNNFGPIADNSGGISEMSGQEGIVRNRTDKLDAAGNTTKAATYLFLSYYYIFYIIYDILLFFPFFNLYFLIQFTSGYSLASATLACYLLFTTNIERFSSLLPTPINNISLSKLEVIAAGMIGVTLLYYFVGLAIDAVGITASQVVNEVRYQFRTKSGILAGTEKPDYEKCVEICTKSALKQMVYPTIIVILSPLFIGFIFKFIGIYKGDPNLAAEVMCGFLMITIIAGILFAMFLDNSGGAWDNAKKYIETGELGGKQSDAHKASVTGDTVGDPLKDTAGPSIHVVIKSISTCITVFGPLFI
ncbi:hypothetical protein WA158_003056 [Blastocystis sp. Blastoise]